MQTELHTAVIIYLYFQLQMSINSTYPDRYGSVILQHTLDFSSQIALSWISQDFTDDKFYSGSGNRRACLFSKSSLARLQEFWNSSICFYEIKRKNLFKSTCPTGSFTCPGPSGSGKRRALHLMAWCRQATKHYLNQCWPSFTLIYGVTRDQWVNEVSQTHTCIW